MKKVNEEYPGFLDLKSAESLGYYVFDPDINSTCWYIANMPEVAGDKYVGDKWWKWTTDPRTLQFKNLKISKFEKSVWIKIPIPNPKRVDIIDELWNLIEDESLKDLSWDDLLRKYEDIYGEDYFVAWSEMM